MRIHADTLTSLVLGRLGESPSPASAFAGEAEGLSLTALIRSLAPEEASRAILETDHALLDDFSTFGTSVGHSPQGFGYVMLPDDFLRLVSFRMDSWKCAVSQPASPGSAEWRLMDSPCTPLRGSVRNPRCRIVQRGVGKVLEFSPYADEADVTEAIYVARPEFDAEGYMRIPASCLPTTIRNTVASVAALIE